MFANVLVAIVKLLLRVGHGLVTFGSFLQKLEKNLVRIGPSRVFNVMKTPELLAVLLRVVESPMGALFLFVFWAILAFWVSGWGPKFFWVSIICQLLYIGVPLLLLI